MLNIYILCTFVFYLLTAEHQYTPVGSPFLCPPPPPPARFCLQKSVVLALADGAAAPHRKWQQTGRAQRPSSEFGE